MNAYLVRVPAQKQPHHQVHIRGHVGTQKGQLFLVIAAAFQACGAVKRVRLTEDLITDGPDCPRVCLTVINLHAGARLSCSHLRKFVKLDTFRISYKAAVCVFSSDLQGELQLQTTSCAEYLESYLLIKAD